MPYPTQYQINLLTLRTYAARFQAHKAAYLARVIRCLRGELPLASVTLEN